MAYLNQGDPVHGECVTADASAGAAVTFYESGTATARAPTVDEFVIITDLILIADTGGDYVIVYYPIATGVIADGAGLRIVKGKADALGGVAHHFETPRTGPKGYGVAVIADSGKLNVILTGGFCRV